jgi:hypothetical protein
MGNMKVTGISACWWLQNAYDDGGSNLKVYFSLLFLLLMKSTVLYVIHNLKHY